MICTTGSCNQEAAAHFKRCPECIRGVRPAPAVETDPCFLVVAEGKPLSWNNALVRSRYGRSFLSKEARAWKDLVEKEARKAKPQNWPTAATYRVEITSYFKNPACDVDGPIKMALDSLSGVAWEDDRLVLELRAIKRIDKDRQRMEIRVWTL